MDNIENKLPKLLYIGDVPVESSHAGAALIYRLLQNYPPEKLRIIEGNLHASLPERRLPGVAYKQFQVGRGRWLNTRFRGLVSSWFALTATQKTRQVTKLAGDFNPDAVLTVSHDYSWMTASAYAKAKGLPLHLICHDDWPRMTGFKQPLHSRFENKFGEIYRSAASRHCVSPFMVKEYARRYGVTGQVLYPSRDRDTPVMEAVKATATVSRPFTLGYAGSIATGNYVTQLVLLADALAKLRGQLLLFGPFDEKPLVAAGMTLSNVTIGGMLSSKSLVQRLHESADALFLPMSFDDGDEESMALNFPSKLTDYTATGLPLLIWGPETSSAVKWAKSEPGVAAVLSTKDETEMILLLKGLMADFGWRNQLAVASSLAGKHYFDPETARKLFWDTLSGIGSPVFSNKI